MKKILLFIFIIHSVCGISQVISDTMLVYTPEDKLIFDDYVSKFQDKSILPIGDLVLETGFYFMGTPYVSYTLEVSQTEKLIVNLRELDCTTFTENCLALARTLKSDCGPTFETYLCELKKLRYRYGCLNCYPSRLHYFSDWIYDNDKLGIVKDVTEENGGLLFPIAVDAMTRLSRNYKQLANSNFYCQISDIQFEIAKRTYYYIPKTEIDSVDIHDGDILAMTVSGKGMDIMHMGIALHLKGSIYFLHASSLGQKVMITELPFKDYLAGIKSNTGYMIVRPQELQD